MSRTRLLVRNSACAVAFGVVSFFTFVAPRSAEAAFLVTDPGAESFRFLDPGTAGFEFTLSPSATNNIVTALGFIDEGGDGLSSSHQVGLWSGSTLVALVTVEAGTSNPLIDGYRYAQLSEPVTLTLGGTYTLGAQTTGGDRFRDSGSSATFSSEITSSVARWIQEGPGGFSRPTNFGGGTGYMAPNMVMVPEPSTAAFIILGIASAGLRRRRA